MSLRSMIGACVPPSIGRYSLLSVFSEARCPWLGPRFRRSISGRISSRLPDLYLWQFGDETLDARRRDDRFAVDLTRVQTAGVDQAIKSGVRDGKNVLGLFGRVQLPRSVSTETAGNNGHSFTCVRAAPQWQPRPYRQV